MAQRYSGKYSPSGAAPPSMLPEPRHPMQARPKWITIAAIPLLIAAFWQSPEGMVTNLAGFALIAGGMRLTHDGLRAQAAYDARRAARRPAIPRKLFGGLAASVGLALGAWEPGAVMGAGLIGLTGLALHWLAFGTDPMRDKGMDGMDSFQQERANRMIEEGQAHLTQMRDAIRRAGDRQLDDRVARFAATVQALFERVRSDPGDLSAARRYMGIYLMGARDATVKFADLYARTRDQRARAAYEDFLNDLEKDFIARRDQLLEGDRSDLDIEIAVLRDRLAREGVRPDTPTESERPALQSDRAQSLDDLMGKFSPDTADPSGRKRD